MSVFDKIQGTQHHSFYRPAPIGEAMQVVQNLNRRAEQSIAQMNKLELMAGSIPTLTGKDKEFKDQYIASMNDQLNEVMQAPEHAFQKVNRLSQEFAMNPELLAMKNAAAKYAAFNAEYDKDPSKYGDVPAHMMQKALAKYNADGGAAKGQVLNIPKLYEEIDENKWFRENGKAIAASQNGWAFVEETGKFIQSGTKEEIPAEEVQQVLTQAALSDPAMSRQMRGQLEMAKDFNPDMDMDLTGYAANKAVPFANMFGYQKVTNKLSKVPGTGSTANGASDGYQIDLAGATTYNGQAITFKMAPDSYKDAGSFFEVNKNLAESDHPRDIEKLMLRKNAYRRAVKEVAAAENFDPIVTEYLLTADSDDLPITTYDIKPGYEMLGKDWMGMPSVDKETDFEKFEEYLSSRGIQPQQMERYKQQAKRALNGSWLSTDIRDQYDKASQLSIRTQPVSIRQTLGATETQMKDINNAFGINLSQKPEIRVVKEDGSQEAFSREDFAEMYNPATVDLQSADTQGTGSVNMFIENSKGEQEVLTIMTDPQNDQLYTELGRAFAYNAQFSQSPSAAIDNAKKGMNLVMPQLTRSALMSEQTGEPTPLSFGDYTAMVHNKFGVITLERNSDGDYIAKTPTGNLFANSEDFRNLAEGASPKEMAVLINKYVTQNL